MDELDNLMGELLALFNFLDKAQGSDDPKTLSIAAEIKSVLKKHGLDYEEHRLKFDQPIGMILEPIPGYKPPIPSTDEPLFIPPPKL